MTKEQFEALKVGDKITSGSNPYKVIGVYPMQRIIMGEGNTSNTPIPFRYEDVELVVEDKVLEYLKEKNRNGTIEDVGKEIRSIVRKEVIDGLKFPSYDEFFTYWQDNSINNTYHIFITETKRLNGL